MEEGRDVFGSHLFPRLHGSNEGWMQYRERRDDTLHLSIRIEATVSEYIRFFVQEFDFFSSNNYFAKIRLTKTKFCPKFDFWYKIRLFGNSIFLLKN